MVRQPRRAPARRASRRNARIFRPRSRADSAPRAAPAVVAPVAGKDAPFQTLDENARAHIEAALRLAKGVVEGKNGAAALLAINPYTLRARMRKLGVDWSKFRQE